MSFRMPLGFKMKVTFSCVIDGEKVAQVKLMQPVNGWFRRWKPVASTTTKVSDNESDEAIKQRLLTEYYGQSDWL